ncbi:MAG: transposase-like protein, partial [Candidatus Azotimanducaceae bacterium]
TGFLNSVNQYLRPALLGQFTWTRWSLIYHYSLQWHFDTVCCHGNGCHGNGKQHYLWRAVDQDGEVVDVYLQAKRDGNR